MSAPERMELLRVLLDQMEMDLLDDTEPQQPPPISLEFAHKLGKSYLWPLRSDRPLAALFHDATELPATIVRQDDHVETYHDDTLPVTVYKVDDGDGFELRSPNWPEGWEPLAIVVGRFHDGVAFELATIQDVVKKAPRFRSAADVQPFAFAAADETDIFEGRDAPAALEPLRFSSGDLTCYYHPWEALLVAAAKLPVGQDGGLAVAQMSYVAPGGQRVVQRRVIPLRTPDRDLWKGLARFHPPPSVQQEELRLLVRPFKTADLDLLPPDAVSELLAEADFAAMRLHRTADGFGFRPLLPDQRELLADPNARWCLRLARTGREAEDDV